MAAPNPALAGSKTILVGVNGSAKSLRAASFALGVAGSDGSTLVCIYVHHAAGPVGLYPDGVAIIDHAQQVAVEGLQREICGADLPWPIAVEFVTRRGDPTRELARYADEIRADAIVVGRSAKGRHARIGSTGGRLVRLGRWPITIVP